MRSAASCFRIGKVRIRPHNVLRRDRSIIAKKIDATLYHSLTFGCSLTVIKAQVDSMRYILKAWTLFTQPTVTYGTNKVMLLRLLTRVDKKS